jgi:hypothetical protein
MAEAYASITISNLEFPVLLLAQFEPESAATVPNGILLEPSILFFSKLEPYPASAVPYRVLDRLACLEIQDGAGTFRDYDDLLRVFEVEFLGQ